MYAIFEDGSRQFKVSEGDELEIDYRVDAEPGVGVEFPRVLLLSTSEGVTVGRPTVERTKVVGEIVEQTLGKKLYIQKFKRRKNYHRRTGHRQKYTLVRIKQIVTA